MSTPSTTVNLPTILRPHAGGSRRVEASGRTIGEVFATLGDRHPGLAQQLSAGDLPVFVNVFLDDEDIRYLDGLDTTVNDGSEITILPAVAGG